MALALKVMLMRELGCCLVKDKENGVVQVVL